MTATTQAELTDPTHTRSEPGRYWTTANISEATPDVISPMCWSFWGPNMEAGARLAYADLGILSRRELAVPADPNALLVAYFFGRPAMNVDFCRVLFASIPGVSGDDFERDLCGKVRPGVPNEKRLERLPFILVRSPAALVTAGRSLRRFAVEQRAWWEREVRDRTQAGDARARLVDAAARFREAFRVHVRGRFVLTAVQGQLTTLCEKVGRPELTMRLLTGLGGVAETELTEDLHGVGSGALRMDDFLGRHGFHGPHEGNLTSRSWREDPGTLNGLAAALAERPESERPSNREGRAVEARGVAVDELVSSLPRWRRPMARWLCRAAVGAVQDNELGKASYLMAVDGGRAATRDIGDELVAAGALDNGDDAFYFTIEELTGGLPANAREVAAFRRGRREEYRGVDVPVTFTGTPAPVASAPEVEDEPDLVRGLSGASGVVEGRARVIVDPETATPLEPGEVLVCRFTDPSWAPLFALADALVIDIGASASHGAIVARELGVPCVIGTQNGSRRIATGDRLRVDGNAGVVTILERR